MPRVPQYQPQAKPGALPGVRLPTEAPLDAFGGGQAAADVTNAQDKALGGIEAIAAQEKKNADEVKVNEYTAGVSEIGTRLLHDPQNGALTRKGKDAFETPEKVRQAFDDQSTKLEDGLSNEAQRIAARKIRDAHWADVDARLQVHVGQQREVYDKETTVSLVANEQNAAATNYLDPGRIRAAIETQGTALTGMARRNGMPPEALQAALAEATSKTHAAVITRMLTNGDDLPAKDYFDKNRGEITTANELHSVEEALKIGSRLGASQRNATTILQNYGNENLNGALTEARKITDPYIQKATVDEIRSRNEEYDRGKKQNEENVFKIGFGVVEATKAMPDSSLMAQMKPEQWRALEEHVKMLRTGIEPPANGETYYNLRTMSATPELKDTFLKTNLLEYAPKMTHTELHELIEHQTTLRKGGPDAQKLLDGIQTDKQIVDSALSSAGIDPTPDWKSSKGQENAKLNAKLRGYIDQRVRDLQQRTGKKATTDDVQKFTDESMMNMRVGGGGFLGFFDTVKPAFELTPDERAKAQVTIKEVPDEDKQAITRSLTRAGLQVTDDAIIRYYVRGKGGK